MKTIAGTYRRTKDETEFTYRASYTSYVWHAEVVARDGGQRTSITNRVAGNLSGEALKAAVIDWVEDCINGAEDLVR